MSSALIPLAEGFEDLEAITVVDLLRRAEINVTTAGLKKGPITGSRGTTVIPDTSLDEVLDQDFDVIVLPGGLPGSDHLGEDPRIQQLVVKQANNNRYHAAICAAPKVFAEQGLLRNKRGTAFPGRLEALNLPDTTLENQAVVVDGKTITSRGPGTAMDFALTLIELLEGRAKREHVEAALQRA